MQQTSNSTDAVAIAAKIIETIHVELPRALIPLIIAQSRKVYRNERKLCRTYGMEYDDVLQQCAETTWQVMRELGIGNYLTKTTREETNEHNETIKVVVFVPVVEKLASIVAGYKYPSGNSLIPSGDTLKIHEAIVQAGKLPAQTVTSRIIRENKERIATIRALLQYRRKRLGVRNYVEC